MKLKILIGPHANSLSFRYKLGTRKNTCSVIIGRDPDLDVNGCQEVMLLDNSRKGSATNGW